MALSSGERISLRGHIKIMTAGMTASPITNQDGSLDRSIELKEKSVDLTFADKGLDHEKLMTSPRFDVTFVEDFTGVTHLFSQTFFIGEPTSDRGNGEVSGMTIAAEQYIRKSS